MTALLDDAARKRIRELGHTIGTMSESIAIGALYAFWAEATEAAALKCEALDGTAADANDCARAIRGQK